MRIQPGGRHIPCRWRQPPDLQEMDIEARRATPERYPFVALRALLSNYTVPVADATGRICVGLRPRICASLRLVQVCCRLCFQLLLQGVSYL